MVLKFKSPFSFEGNNKDTRTKSTTSGSSDRSSSVNVGLQILTQRSQRKLNILDKSALSRSSSSTQSEYCFLKSCHLCNKKLCLHKDVYMYRGNEGFCSIECRDRKIYLDEMEELEKLAKQRRGHCSTSGHRKSRLVGDDELRHRQRPPHPLHQNHQWSIIS